MSSPYDGPLLSERVLDAQMAELERDAPQPWGVRPWLGPIATVAVTIALLILLRHHLHLHGTSIATYGALVNILGDAVFVGSLVVFGRHVAAAGGGWRRTFGLYAPSWADLRPWLIGVVVVFVARIVVVVVANGLTHGRAGRQSVNLHIDGATHVGAALLVVATVIAAPLAEELMFRGVLLRVFMRRMPFWPAALLGSLIFAGFHTYEVRTVAGAATLGASTLALALTNCVLVRVTGRLTPGVLVHMSFNLLATVILLRTDH